MNQLEDAIATLERKLETAMDRAKEAEFWLPAEGKPGRHQAVLEVTRLRKEAGKIELELNRKRRELVEHQNDLQRRRDARNANSSKSTERNKLLEQFEQAKKQFYRTPHDTSLMTRISVLRRKLKELDTHSEQVR